MHDLCGEMETAFEPPEGVRRTAVTRLKAAALAVPPATVPEPYDPTTTVNFSPVMRVNDDRSRPPAEVHAAVLALFDAALEPARWQPPLSAAGASARSRPTGGVGPKPPAGGIGPKPPPGGIGSRSRVQAAVLPTVLR